MLFSKHFLVLKYFNNLSQFCQFRLYRTSGLQLSHPSKRTSARGKLQKCMKTSYFWRGIPPVGLHWAVFKYKRMLSLQIETRVVPIHWRFYWWVTDSMNYLDFWLSPSLYARIQHYIECFCDEKLCIHRSVSFTKFTIFYFKFLELQNEV